MLSIVILWQFLLLPTHIWLFVSMIFIIDCVWGTVFQHWLCRLVVHLPIPVCRFTVYFLLCYWLKWSLQKWLLSMLTNPVETIICSAWWCLMQLKLMEVSIGAFNDGSKGTNYYWYYFNSVALHLHQSISLENISSFSIAVFALGTQHCIVVSTINASSSFTIMCLVAATLYPSAMIVLSKFLHFDGYSSVLWLTS